MKDTPSVTDPVGQAIDWTARVLFKPFDIGKWFVLGFCAWLAWIGQGGGSSGNWDIPGDDRHMGTEAAKDWLWANLALVIVIVAVLVLFIVGLVVLLTWLSSRGKLMFLDGVVHNRGAVVEPWNRFQAQADSLFFFRIVVGLIALLVFSVLVGGPLAVALTVLDIDFGHPGPGVILILSLWIAVTVGVSIVFGLIAVAVNDIVVPIMWLRGCLVLEAWAEFRSLLSAHAGTFVLYVLMKILFAIVIGIIGCAAACLTCCIAALPYIGAVILLPLYVFRRSYSIYFLSQFGPAYAPLGPVDAPPAPGQDEG